VWAEALDVKTEHRRPLGALKKFAPEDPTLDGVRAAFGERLRHTPGIIASRGGEVAASIRVELAKVHVPEIAEAVRRMRSTWCTPGGEEFSEPADLWRHARELANGFYYRWDPAAPEDWLWSRSECTRFVREKLKRSRTYETPAQIMAAFEDVAVVQDWVAIRDTFKPNPVPVWITDAVIDMAAASPEELIWVEHRAVGQRLQEKHGIPYFGQQGLDSAGNSVIEHRGRCAVSQAACSAGFNLQRYNTNLLLNFTPMGLRLEQLMGRTHRPGQEADTVWFRVLCAVGEQLAGFEQAQRDADYEQRMTGQHQKLCLADVTTTGALSA
jgi:hypothetical protein